MAMRWYVVHAYSGFEKSVQRALIDRIKRSEIADQFGQILLSTVEVLGLDVNGDDETQVKVDATFLDNGGGAAIPVDRIARKAEGLDKAVIRHLFLMTMADHADSVEFHGDPV